MMRENWMLGFLGFLGFMGFQGVAGLAEGDWLQEINIFWFAFFAWFTYFIPSKEPAAKPRA